MRVLITLAVFLLLHACKHPLAIEGEGDIIERLAGQRGCSLEESQTNSPRCTENEVTDEDYIVSYEAVPRPGWRFVAWRGGTACSPDSVPPYCDFNVPQAFVAYMDEEFPDYAFPATVAVFGQPDTWTLKAEMLTGRGSTGTCVINDKLYVIGGKAVTQGPGLATVEQYDPATDTWSTRADMPTPRLGITASAVNGKCYVMGGVPLSADVQALTTVEAYDPEKNSWQQMAALPQRRVGAASAVVDGKIYLIGGGEGFALVTQPIASVAIYDPITDQWSTGADMLTPRTGLSAVAINGLIYSVGGRVKFSASSAAERYDPVANEWTALTGMPNSRTFLSASAIGSALFAIGGNVGSVRSEATRIVERYDTETDQWVTVSDMGETRFIHSSEAIGARILVVGGLPGRPLGSEPALKVVGEYTP